MGFGQGFDLYLERKWNLERRVDAHEFAESTMDWTSETLEVSEKDFGAFLNSRFVDGVDENKMEWTSSLEEESSATIHDMVMGGMKHEELVFVLVDSCAFCCKTIEQYLDELRSEYKDGTRFVVVKSNTSFIENNYKIVHSENYGNVNFKVLTKNLSTLGQLAFGQNSKSLPSFETLAIPLEFEFMLYHSELVNHFKLANPFQNNPMSPKEQCQMNDNVQIELAYAISTTVLGARVLMITADKLMMTILNRKRNGQNLSIDIRDVVGNYV